MYKISQILISLVAIFCIVGCASQDGLSQNSSENVQRNTQESISPSETTDASNLASSESKNSQEGKTFTSADNGSTEPVLVCRREKILGSNMRKRVCYRKTDIEDRMATDQEDLRERQISQPRPAFND